MADRRLLDSAAQFIPPRSTLATLRQAVQGCRGCELYRYASRAVFGEGPRTARLMFVGEEPGDQEDRAGRPFVGPAGKVLDAAFAAAGIERRTVYLTNIVKHFKFARRELIKRRLHKPPVLSEVRACQPWLQEEIRLVKPEIVVALGGTAAKGMLGSGFSVTRERGKLVQSDWAGLVFPTVHPSSVLRAPSGERRQARAEFFADILQLKGLLRFKAS